MIHLVSAVLSLLTIELNNYDSGVMEIYGESSFNIINSVFTLNSAGYFGGVMTTYGKILFNITSCVF